MKKNENEREAKIDEVKNDEINYQQNNEVVQENPEEKNEIKIEEKVKAKDVLFKNTSKMDDEEITVFQNYALKKTMLTTSILFALIFVAFGIGASFLDLTMGIVLIVCGLLGGFVLLPFLLKETVKKQNKVTLGDKKYLNTFEFCEEFLFVTSQATSSKETNDYQDVASQKIFYKDMFKVVSYIEFLFIYLNSKQSLILNFKGMTGGTAGELIEFLKMKNIKFVDRSSEKTPEIKNK